MNIRLQRAGWNVRITWAGIDLRPIDDPITTPSEVRVRPGVSGRLRRVVTSWLTHLT
ncbi:MAG: hypothetical protein ABI882_16970 [Acidobacteriota bacterium]